jgi:Tannase and feruloyl esterase
MGAGAVDGSLRLYMVPGMQHRGGGAGVTGFVSDIPTGDRFHDADAALEAWMEQSQPPSPPSATHPALSSALARSAPTRAVATYKSVGSTDEASDLKWRQAFQLRY